VYVAGVDAAAEMPTPRRFVAPPITSGQRARAGSSPLVVRPVPDDVEGPVSAEVTAPVRALCAIKLTVTTRFRDRHRRPGRPDGQYDFVLKQPNQRNIDPYEKYWKPVRQLQTGSLLAATADSSGATTWGGRSSRASGIRPTWSTIWTRRPGQVAVKTGEGDRVPGRPRAERPGVPDCPGRQTGQAVTRVGLAVREVFADRTSSPYNYASRNQLGVA